MKQIHLFKKGFVIFLKGATFSDFIETSLSESAFRYSGGFFFNQVQTSSSSEQLYERFNGGRSMQVGVFGSDFQHRTALVGRAHISKNFEIGPAVFLPHLWRVTQVIFFSLQCTALEILLKDHFNYFIKSKKIKMNEICYEITKCSLGFKQIIKFSFDITKAGKSRFEKVFANLVDSLYELNHFKRSDIEFLLYKWPLRSIFYFIRFFIY